MLLAILMKAGPASPLVLSITDATPSGADSGAAASGYVSSNSTTVSVVSGGTGSYTFAWAITGSASSSGPYNCISPAAATTNWDDTVSDINPGDPEEWTCTVTDTGNDKVATIIADVSLDWTDIT